MFFAILILVFIVFVYYYYTKHNKISPEYNMPTGPSGISLYGNLFQVLSKPHLQFSKWAYKYGKAYTINIFGAHVLVANDAKTIKQVLGKIESTGQISTVAFDKLSGGGKHGILATDGEVWEEVRTFTMKALKNCGISRSSVVEAAVWRSCNGILEWFEEASKTCSVVYPLREKFIDSIGNVFWSIATRSDKQCSKSDTGKLVANFIDALNMTTKSGLLFFPWLRHIAPEWSGYNKLSQACTALHLQADKYFEERKQYRKIEKLEPENRNLLDAYLDKWENCTDETSCFYGEVGWKHCFYSLIHIVVAAGEATATTMSWLVNYLVACPDVQQKLSNEVKTVLENEMPTLMETRRLPYLEAVIQETLRMSSIAPFGFVQKLLDSVMFEGYHLPKGTFLVPNMYHVHNDKTVWTDPENFRPERFLEADEIEKIRLRQSIVAFQPGKRYCPGEGLGRDMMFLVTARLVQKLEFLPASGKEPRDYIEPVAGYLLCPKQIGVKVKARL